MYDFSPKNPTYFPYSYITQDDFFTNEVLNQVSLQSILSKGLTLDKLGDIVETFYVKVDVTHLDESISYDDFMNIFTENMLSPNNYIIINYHREAVGQAGGGHFSPIAAYNKKVDMFLILDVSRYKYAPLWVKSKTLFEAMRGIDSDSKLARGFLEISPIK